MKIASIKADEMMKVFCAILILAFVIQSNAQATLRVAPCSYYVHPVFGYGCEVADLEFLSGDTLQITGSHQQGRNNAQVLFVEILNSTVEVIPQQYFAQFTNLERFYSQSVSISILNRLVSCENLKFLYLSGNYLETISDDTFVDCGKLEVLHLQGNLINSIARWAFRNLDQLQVLLLNNNQLETINPDLFTTTPNLSDLGLSDNSLSTLNSRTFTPTPLLETLRLANNYFSVLNVNLLQNLTRLSTLLLNGNQFDNFQANFFRHLPSLTHLNINDNSVAFDHFCH